VLGVMSVSKELLESTWMTVELSHWSVCLETCDALGSWLSFAKLLSSHPLLNCDYFKLVTINFTN